MNESLKILLAVLASVPVGIWKVREKRKNDEWLADKRKLKDENEAKDY